MWGINWPDFTYTLLHILFPEPLSFTVLIVSIVKDFDLCCLCCRVMCVIYKSLPWNLMQTASKNVALRMFLFFTFVPVLSWLPSTFTTALKLSHLLFTFTLTDTLKKWVNKKNCLLLTSYDSVEPLPGVGRLRGLSASPNLRLTLWKHCGVVRQWHQLLVLQLFLLSRL